jgi:hypothetical protein
MKLKIWGKNRENISLSPPHKTEKPYLVIKKITIENRIELLNKALAENNISIDAVISINETQYHINIYYKSIN